MKRLRILLTTLIFTIGLACFSQTAMAATETTLTSLMEVLKEDQKEAVYNINLNAPFSKESAGIRETISTETGELILRSEIFHIPGRNGKDISLDLVYRSRDAKLYEEGTSCGDETNGYGENIIAYYDVFDTNGYWLRTGALKYTTSDTTIMGEVSLGDETWIFTGYLQYESGTSLMQESGIVNTQREKSVLSASKYIFGEGWSLDMPSLILDGDSVYVSLRNGQTYQADFTGGMGLKDYELFDVVFTEDTSESNGTDTSAYKLYYTTGDAYYFTVNGQILKEEDRFGNEIRYRWKTIDGIRLLVKVEDSAGHIVDIDYQNETITFRSGERMYTLEKEGISQESGKYYLASLTDPEGREISYKYEFNEAEFDILDSTNAENKYANLVEVMYPTGAKTEYSYEKSKKNLGQSGFMEYFKVSERKDVEENEESNVQRYMYYNEPDGYPTYDSYDMSDGYRYYSEVIDDNGLTVKHSYNSSHQQFLKEISGERPFESVRTLYNLKNHMPEKIFTTVYDEELNTRKATDLYGYDYRGNLIYEKHLTDETLEPEDAQETFYEYDYEFNLMTEKRYKQDESTEIRESYVLSEDKKTVVEETLHSNSELLKSNKYNYDESGNLIELKTEEDPGVWRTVRYEYSPDYGYAYLTSVVYEDVMDANGLTEDIQLSYGYDYATGDRISETDGNGNTVSYEYDKMGRLTSETLPDEASRTYIYDDANNTATTVDACGNGMKYYYSGLGNLEKVEDISSEDILTTLEYDNFDRIIRRYDANGNYQAWTYDDLSRLESTSQFDSKGQIMSRTEMTFDEVYTYDGRKYNKVEVSEKGASEDRVLIYLFDQNERLAVLGRVTEAGEEYTTYGYDYAGNNIKSTDFSGATEEYQYDGMNRVIKSINAEGGITENIYDLAGNLVETVDPLGNSIHYGYDSLGRNTTKSTPFEEDTYSTYRTFYDNDGNVSATIDPLGNSTRYNFNNRGFLISVELGAGTNDSLLTRYSYDEEGRLETTVTGLSNILDRDYAVKSYEYDSLGRLVSETDPEGNHTLYEYDGNGNILRKTDRNGVTIEYRYDGLNRIVSEKNSKDGDEKEIEFAYDLLGNTVRMSDVTGTTIYEYDNLGRLSCIYYGDGIRQMYSYDSSDQVTNLRLVRNGLDELDIMYGYDNLGRLSEVEDEGIRYAYRYDESGRLEEEVNEHTGLRTLYEYYPSGNVKSLVHRNGDEILGAYSYGYNQNGNMVYEVTEEGTTRYYYDHMSRLDTAIMKDGNIQQYEYDDFNNIKRLVEIQGTSFGSSMIFENTYAYDHNGRLLSKKNIRGDNVEELCFTYDS